MVVGMSVSDLTHLVDVEDSVLQADEVLGGPALPQPPGGLLHDGLPQEMGQHHPHADAVLSDRLFLLIPCIDEASPPIKKAIRVIPLKSK